MISLIPYTEVDGVITYKDSEIMSLYDRMVQNGSTEATFSDGCVQSREEFLDMAKNCAFFVVLNNKETVGFTWITDIYQVRAQAHFCFFRDSNDWAKNSTKIGREVATKLINLKSKDGYVFDVLIGITPNENLPANIWLARIGLKKIGEIPNGVFNAKQKQSTTATLWYLIREE